MNNAAISLICAGLIAGAFACGTGAPDDAAKKACGPFGNPSAAVFSEVRPNCGDGKLLGPWKDYEGIDRYACLYEPNLAAANSKSAAHPDKLPMLVYLHPSLFSAGWITQTNLLEHQNTTSLSIDPTHFGYVVLAPEGRNTTHFYPFPDNKGTGWDNWYRQLDPAGDVTIGNTTFRENVDAVAIDHFIAEQVATGRIDTDRIYISGWSNGAAMAYLYALNRPNIAAAAVYSAPNPFGAFNDACPQTPVSHAPANDSQVRIFNPSIPTMHVHNDCDIGGICPNGELLTTQLRSAGVSVDDVILDYDRHRVAACMASCGIDPKGDVEGKVNPWRSTEGTMNHARWPDARTVAILDFFRHHPLKPPP